MMTSRAFSDVASDYRRIICDFNSRREYMTLTTTFNTLNDFIVDGYEQNDIKLWVVFNNMKLRRSMKLDCDYPFSMSMEEDDALDSVAFLQALEESDDRNELEFVNGLSNLEYYRFAGSYNVDDYLLHSGMDDRELSSDFLQKLTIFNIKKSKFDATASRRIGYNPLIVYRKIDPSVTEQVDKMPIDKYATFIDSGIQTGELSMFTKKGRHAIEMRISRINNDNSKDIADWRLCKADVVDAFFTRAAAREDIINIEKGNEFETAGLDIGSLVEIDKLHGPAVRRKMYNKDLESGKIVRKIRPSFTSAPISAVFARIPGLRDAVEILYPFPKEYLSIYGSVSSLIKDQFLQFINGDSLGHCKNFLSLSQSFKSELIRDLLSDYKLPIEYHDLSITPKLPIIGTSMNASDFGITGSTAVSLDDVLLSFNTVADYEKIYEFAMHDRDFTYVRTRRFPDEKKHVQFFKSLLDWMSTSNGLDMRLIFVGYQYGAEGHQNFIILNYKEKELVYFEPTGGDERVMPFIKTLRQFITKLTPSWQMVDNTDLPSSWKWQMSNDLCQSWSAMVAILYIINPHIDIISINKDLSFVGNEKRKGEMLAIFMFWMCAGRPTKEIAESSLSVTPSGSIKRDLAYLRSSISAEILEN